MQTDSNWHDQRRQGIGGSDAGAICGVNKWKSPYQVWQEKRGLTPPTPDNEAMYWGRSLEPNVRQRYADVTGREVRVPSVILSHPDYPFMLANVDGLTDDRRVVEIKTSRSSEGWGESGSDEIPLSYLFQVQHYMAVTAYDVADVAVLIGGSDFRMYEIPYDKELQGMLIEKESEFWEMVQTNTPPEPVSVADMLLRFSTSTAKEVTATKQVENALIEIVNLSRLIKGHEENLEEMKAVVMAHMGDADTLLNLQGKPIATWKSSKPRETFDSKRFQTIHPELYPQFIKTGEASRRFLLK
jgi:putative phage-type endonuclease